MTKDAIEDRLNLVAEMLQRAVNEITGVLSDLDTLTADPDGDDQKDGPEHGSQDS